MRDIANQFLHDHFGLGSSTRGMTMDEHNRGRTEAEVRAARKPKVQCRAGETFEQMERRLAREAYNAMLLLESQYLSRMEDAGKSKGQIESAVEYFNEMRSEFWADERAEE